MERLGESVHIFRTLQAKRVGPVSIAGIATVISGTKVGAAVGVGGNQFYTRFDGGTGTSTYRTYDAGTSA